MSLKHHTLLLLVAAATIFLAGTATATSDNIPLLCAKSQYPAVCLRVTKGETTALSATISIIKLLVRKSTSASSLTHILAPKADAFSKLLLDTCREVYLDAIDELGNSMNAIKNKAKSDLNTALSAVMSDYGSCNDGFLGGEESPLGGGEGHPNPLNKINARLFKLTSTALALSDAIFH